jgi:hypothetical protein
MLTAFVVSGACDSDGDSDGAVDPVAAEGVSSIGGVGVPPGACDVQAVRTRRTTAVPRSSRGTCADTQAP